nr:rhomboid family intrarane serine protease [Chitinophagaceae bacterium]
MTEPIEMTSEENAFFKKYIPMLTLACCALSITLFIGINLERTPLTWEAYKRWGGPNETDIFNGSYWGLITSNFLHIEIWHIFFNIYWIWILGKKIEYESNKFFYGLLIITSALASSCIQLAFSNGTGIGLSGIAYAFFGFIYIKSLSEEEYKNYIDNRTSLLFMIWLVLCIVLTQTGTFNVANGGHIGGLLWGAALAYLSRFSFFKQWVGGLLVITIMVSSIFWSPFSIAWLSHESYKLHSEGKLDEAAVIYEKILAVDSDNTFARENLKVIQIYNLSLKAKELNQKGLYKEQVEVYKQILTIDSTNKWAKQWLEYLQVK